MEERKLSRRDFLCLSAATVAATVLVSCRPAATPVAPPPEEKVEEKPPEEKPPKPAEEVTLHYWFAWGESFADAVRSAADSDEWKQGYPGIKVEPLPGAGDEKLLASIAAGEPPDGASNISYPEFFARGAATPVSEWVNASKVIDKEDVFKETLDGAIYKGEMYGVPAAEGFLRYGLCFNVDLVKEAGLDPDSPPQTWDEAFQWHQTLTKFDAAGNVTLVGFDPLDAMGGSIGYGDPFMWPICWGFDYYDEAKEEFNLDNADMVEGFATIKKFYDFVGAEKMAAFRESYGTWTGPNAGFIVGTQAVQINGYWTPGEAAHLAPDKNYGYSWIPVPARRKGTKVQSTGGHYIVIPKGAKHPEQMFHFAQFLLMSDVANDAIFNALGWLPPRKSYMKKADIGKYPGLDWFVRSAEEADEMGAVEMNPITSVTADKWGDATDGVIYGEMTPQEAAKFMQEELTEELRKLLGK